MTAVFSVITLLMASIDSRSFSCTPLMYHIKIKQMAIGNKLLLISWVIRVIVSAFIESPPFYWPHGGTAESDGETTQLLHLTPAAVQPIVRARHTLSDDVPPPQRQYRGFPQNCQQVVDKFSPTPFTPVKLLVY